jgi:FemAB-related protein (PEP-CTERM system-associated)
LLEKASEIACRLKVKHIELRHGTTLECAWEETTSKVTMKVLLPGKSGDLWSRISTGLRNKIRKAQNSDFRIESGGAEAVDTFYPVFAMNMRNLGTPVYPKKWFEAIARAAGDQLRIFTLFDGARAVASAFLLAHRNELELPWSASVPESRKKYSHLLLYWIFLEWAIQNGFRSVDLGRCTPGSGTYEFKRHWGCEEQVLHWYHWVAPGKLVPQLRPENSKFQLATRVWRRLPLAIANGLGPRIVRGLP